MLKNLRDKSDTDYLENSISQLSDQFDAKSKLEKDPYASIYTRVFGNEIQYSEFHGLKDMLSSLSDLSYFDITRKISQEENINYTKSFVIVDGLYSIPTCVGFPMNLNLNGTAVVSFKLQGHANIKWNSLDIEGSISPSAAVAFTGTMAVDAKVAKAGIRLLNTLHTNTYIDGKIKIQGGNLIEFKLNVPRDKIEVLEVSSQLFVLNNDQYLESKGIEDNMENYKICSTEFITSLSGMKSCMELTYVNTSVKPEAPYFPLTGPFKFHVDITKVDTFSAYVLIFKQQEVRTINYWETLLNFHFDTPGSKVNRKLSAQYMIDWKNSVAKASFISPFIKMAASGKIENSDSAKTLDATISFNDEELITTRLGLKKFRTGYPQRYEPFFSLLYRKRLLADINGKINYVERLKWNADFLIKGLSKDPISISGDFNGNEDKYELFADIKSNFLTSSFQAGFRSTGNSLSTKITVQYKMRSSQQHTVAFSARLQDNSKGILLRESLYMALQMSQFPHYNAEALWDIQYSEKYFENNIKLTIGETVWNMQQLYRHYSTHSNVEFAALCTLTCSALNIGYGVDILYQVTNESISSHIITTVTPRYKMSGSFDYLHRKNQHNLDLNITSPWYKTGLTGTLTEKNPGRHEVEASSWWIEGKHLRTLNATGFYIDGSNRIKTEHLLDVTLNGVINGKLGAGITSSSNFNNQWIKLKTDNKIYLANATYIKDVFHFMEGTLKLGDSTYSGSLVLLSTAVEKGFAIDLKLRKRLTMATKIICDGEKHGLQVELFWDKDANPNKKISLMAQAMGNRKEVLLEIPGRYLKGEVVTIPSGVIGLLEWAEHQKISAHLEWNLDHGSAEITIKLKTPFPSMESLSLFATYTMLENEGIFVVDGSWQKEKLTLTATLRKNSSISDFWGMKLITHMESTIPTLEHLSFNVDHSSYVNTKWAFKTVALLKYNNKQSDFEANWNCNNSSLYADIMLTSPIHNFEYMKSILKYTETPEDISGSLELNWTQQNKISGEFIIKKVTGASGAFKIVTPFVGYEITSAEYNFTKLIDKNNTTYIMKADAIYNLHTVKFDISGSKTKSSFNGNLQIKTPFTEHFKLNVLHSLMKGKLNDLFTASLAEKQLLQLFLDVEANSVSDLQLTASAKIPNQEMQIFVKQYLNPINIQLYCQGIWNNKSLLITATGKCVNNNKVLSVQFDGKLNGTVVPQELKILLNHSSMGGESNTTLQLPYNILLTNILTSNNEGKWENRLSFTMPTKSLVIENKQNVNQSIIEHEMTSKFNGQQASAVIYLSKEPTVAKANLITPWSDPITIEYIIPVDSLTLKPRFTLKFKQNKEIRVETEIKFKAYDSKIFMKITSPFYKPIIIDSSYKLEETNLSSQMLIQWESKNIKAEAKAQFVPSLMKSSGGFFIRHSDMTSDVASGSFGYNIADTEITARILGTLKESKIDSVLSLMASNNIYKGKIAVQTPLKNWENLSLSGELDVARTNKVLSKVKFTKGTKNMTLFSLFGFDMESSRYRLTVEGNIFDIHKFSIYGDYNISEPNNHILNIAMGYEDQIYELSTKLLTDKNSLLNSIAAECDLKTPFHNYKRLSVHGSYNMKGTDKTLDLRLIKDTWIFRIESLVSFGIEKGKSHIKVLLPLEELKELSASVQYGFNPITQERTINLKILRDNLVVDVLGALLLTDNGSVTAGLEVTSPLEGYQKT
ncbi:hypothetical protein L9F63_022120 [Diploptera punctata]|uniref:Vitellinogen open beta-sheet domain-containing protein n=1 Tax=Diploptera punctata TaxID=6984 RepID=A0AAD7ZMR0_DIPPU|nr:hypothetical protein L9F63_022120 [Diploptera punctata]